MSNYKELKVWQVSMELVLDIYKLTKEFPKDEKYGLVSQMRRAAVSIASNITEGSGRDTKGFFYNFLNYAKGSTCELETQILIAHKLGFIPEKKKNELTFIIARILWMLHKLKSSLN